MCVKNSLLIKISGVHKMGPACTGLKYLFLGMWETNDDKYDTRVNYQVSNP